jgi:two-component system KDP operon response regulator KdpE
MAWKLPIWASQNYPGTDDSYTTGPAMKRVLIIADGPRSGNLLTASLKKNGYDVSTTATVLEGVRRLRWFKPDLLLLEINPPITEGLTTLADIRSWSSVPMLVLSASEGATEGASLLDAGADDFMTMPFNLEELLARIHAVLRRTLPSYNESLLVFGDLKIDLDSRTVSVGERQIVLTATEYAILAFLARNRGKVVTNARLITELWGPDAEKGEKTLRVHIWSLRKKLEHDPKRPEYLMTKPGVGHMLAWSLHVAPGVS